MAIRFGADCLGLVGAMPTGPGPIPDIEIATIARSVSPGVSTFLLTSRTEPADVVAHVQACGTSVVQIVDSVPRATYTALREACPAVRIVQVVHVEDAAALDTAASLTGDVDAVLLDSGRPNAAVRELGGTGRSHDWRISRRVVEASSVPVFLAGGLAPENIAEAIQTVRPFGVDLCTGVRTEGRLDPVLLGRFMEKVREADDHLGAPGR